MNDESKPDRPLWRQPYVIAAALILAVVVFVLGYVWLGPMVEPQGAGEAQTEMSQ